MWPQTEATAAYRTRLFHVAAEFSSSEEKQADKVPSDVGAAGDALPKHSDRLAALIIGSIHQIKLHHWPDLEK